MTTLSQKSCSRRQAPHQRCERTTFVRIFCGSDGRPVGRCGSHSANDSHVCTLWSFLVHGNCQHERCAVVRTVRNYIKNRCGPPCISCIHNFVRLRLYLVPVKHHPQVPFVRRVPTWKMHVFTLVQILALAMLWAVKSSKFSLAFPFFLVLMVPIRKQMERIFTPLELRAVWKK